VQGLQDVGVEGRLGLVTRGAVSVGEGGDGVGATGGGERVATVGEGGDRVGTAGEGDRVESPTQAMVWGLGRTLALEQPQRWGGLVDLPPTLEEQDLEGLCAALGGLGDEDQLAVREAGVFARRLVRAPVGQAGNGAGNRHGSGAAGDRPGTGVVGGPGTGAGDGPGTGVVGGPGTGAGDGPGTGVVGGPEAGTEWRPRGTALVTGGTGGLGAQVALWLAQTGVTHLLLASRRGLAAPGAAELVQELEDRGVGVSVVACDVADRAQVQGLLERVPAEHPLDTVVHAAGGSTVCALDVLTVEQCEATLAAKVGGARHLHELTQGAELSAFVLFSSLAATTGSGGQGDYAAANAFLDGLAEHRRAQGLAGTSVAWGLWGVVGAGVGAERESARRGILEMAPERAVAELQLALDRGETCLTVARIDWQRYAPSYASARVRPLIEGLPEVQRALGQAGEPREDAHGGALAARLAGLSSRERERAAVELVCSHAAVVLGHEEVADVQAQRPFKELGFDSLMAVQLRDRLQTATGLRLPSTLVFDHPTPAVLARYLVEEAVGEGAMGTPRGGAAGAPRGVVAGGPTRVSAEEPIAIVGMSCRYPGGVRSPQDLWALLARGGDAIGAFPTDRGWDLDALRDLDPERSGTSHAPEGGFVHDIGEFDAAFFEIAPNEALAMDPQQRLLLEACWESLEHAGIGALALRGSQTGVFAGINPSDYGAYLPEELEGYRMTSGAGSVVSGRVAYSFGFEGPAVSVDTACSSSLVALHLACGALRAGECSLALAGGVAAMATPFAFVAFARQGGLAGDGRCKSFARDADGTGWSEGVGVVLLERLEDAQRNGHPVLAVVRGSAVNQDGASNGLTAPNGPSQQRVIRQALANARLSAPQVDAVEGHGTGTTLGDPIEAQALLATYGQDRPPDRPLWLGSVKSNLGHPQAAAGVAGLIKMVLALQHGVLPRTLHAAEPSTQVDWSSGAVSLLVEEVPWPRGDEPRRAGVSSFGVSGTNAHVILEEAPSSPSAAGAAAAPSSLAPSAGPQEAAPLPGPSAGSGEVAPSAGPQEPVPLPSSSPGEDVLSGVLGAGVLPWAVSGRGAGGLRGQGRALLEWVEGDPALSLVDVGFSLATSRSALEDRAVLVGAGRDSLLEGLRALARGEDAPGLVRGSVRGAGTQLAYLFTGQGAQRVGMGRELYESLPVFRAAFEEACGHLDGLLGRSLREVVFGEGPGERLVGGGGVGSGGVGADEGGVGMSDAGGGLLDETLFTQTGLFVVEVALFRQLEAWGLTPDYLVGHSVGELAAAHVGGVLSLEDACALVAVRGQLMGALPQGGAMVAVAASEQAALEVLAGHEDTVSLAAVNGPEAVVVSGDEDVVLRLAGVFEERGCKTKRLRVSQAFHSPRLDGVLGELEALAARLSFSAPRIPIVSNLTGEPVTAEQVCDPAYWVRHAREPVRFYDAVRWLGRQGVGSLLELGPEGVLSAMAHDCLASEGPGGRGRTRAVATPVLRGGRPEVRVLAGALAEVWVRGVHVDWDTLFEGTGARQVKLPAYAFQRRRYWLQAPAAGPGDVASTGLDVGGHPLLGAALPLADGQGWVFTSSLSLERTPWLAEHVVMGAVLVPGTTHVEIALHAARVAGCDTVQELVMEEPVVLAEHEQVTLQVAVGAPDAAGRRALTIHTTRQAPHGGEAPHEQEPPQGQGLPYEQGPRQEQESPHERVWTRLASGVLVSSGAHGADRGAALALRASSVTGGVWPPPGADSLPADELHELLAELGFAYGPAFKATTAIWRRGEELFAEVRLPEAYHAQARTYGLHPALLDSALQIGVLFGPRLQQMVIPFSWSGASAHAAGACALRVRVAPTPGGGVSLIAADELGTVVLALNSVVAREVFREQIERLRSGGDGSLLRVAWEPLPAAAQGSSADADTVLVMAEERAGGEDTSGATAASACARRVLGLMQAWLAREGLGESTMVVVTRGALAVGAGDQVQGLAQAAVWGLVRSAQAEHPGRFVLVDLDEEESSTEALRGSVADALESREPQIAIRAGVAFVPRLRRVSRPAPVTPEGGAVDGVEAAEQAAGRPGIPASEGEAVGEVGEQAEGRAAPTAAGGEVVGEAGAEDLPSRAALRPARPGHRFDAHGTVLLTGGTGGLGALLAKHLASTHGVRHLLLVSRRGEHAPGAADLREALARLGADVRIAACDVADRGQLQSLLDSISAEHPLRAVVHAAGVLDDGVFDALTPERLDAVLAPKAAAALHLHELTQGADLSAFVLFSSVAGLLGAQGQGNYAAANTLLDALAAHRRAHGLPAVSIAWGPWAQAEGMVDRLSDANQSRGARLGVTPLAPQEGLELFDAAGALEEALLVALRLEAGALRTQAAAGVLAPMLRGLVRTPLRAEPERGLLVKRLATVPAHEHAQVVQDAVCAQAALVLGYGSPGDIEVRLTFKELGFDSLAAVEFRNRLAAATELTLPATLIFDYPTPLALVDHLLGELGPGGVAPVDPFDPELDELERRLASLPVDDAHRLRVKRRLQTIVSGLGDEHPPEDGSGVVQLMRGASAEEVFDFIDGELQRP
jgi:acyl transferase domain-containing protein/acyl carrier protein